MAADLPGYEPAELAPPGETLLDWLEEEGMSQADFARRTNLTPKHINQVVKGTVSLTPEVTLMFERVTGIPARYWSQLEANYQAAKQRAEEAKTLHDHLDLVAKFPIKELERRGHIARVKSRIDQLRELLRFFKVANVDALREVWLAPALYRLSPAFEADNAALVSWLRLAEIEAAKIQTQLFDAAASRAAVDRMREMTRMPGATWIEPLRILCASVGIALVIVAELPRSRVNGATRWLSQDKAMIALSLRGRRSDIVWFTFFHELCHILRHGKKDTFIDVGAGGSELETEADTFAARVLIPAHLAGRLRTLPTVAAIVEFADEIGVHPGIIVGRMWHEKITPPPRSNDLFERIPETP